MIKSLPNNVKIRDKELFIAKIKIFKQHGADSIQVISDFDRTLTYCFIDGKRSPTSAGVIRYGNYLTPDYPEKAFALYNKYRPIEVDQSKSIEERSKEMHNWWSEHIRLMVKSGLNINIFEDVLQKYPKILRNKSVEVFAFLREQNIPILIFSAGFGDVIRLYLNGKSLYTKNVHIISNFFRFDEKGDVKGYQGEIIHSLNKSEVNINNPSYKKDTINRKNIILLGDSIGDLGMSKGIEYDNIIRIAFLNENIEESTKEFTEKFDVVITNDSDMSFVFNLLKEILTKIS